ncbi:MAG TPA: hypothetical protein VFB67_09650 [Candidatus Polarisedimenticolaceae bacterium]|nr:hypothetical protein [Candidatus Polarisedimenticolaceae bacterium]
MRSIVAMSSAAVILFAAAGSSFALVAQRAPSRFDRLVKLDPAVSLGAVAESPESLPEYDAERAGWSQFRNDIGGKWSIHIDRRSGAPLLVEGSGMRLIPAGETAATLGDLESRIRAFVQSRELLFKVRSSEMVLEAEGSGAIDRDHWILLFTRRVDGLPVDDERFLVNVTRGNLVAFGADRWGAIGAVPEIAYTRETARAVLLTYMGIGPSETVEWIDGGTLMLSARAPEPSAEGRFGGAVGRGIAYAAVHRFVLRVPGEPGIWLAKVDATTGEVVALGDDTKYAQAKGGVYPVSDDQSCPDGCEQSNWPMPYADITINGVPQTAGDMGSFDCSPSGGSAVSHLAGPYVRVVDVCGPVSESVTCEEDLDFRQGPGIDCAVPSGSSPGNTHSARSGFYHLNRIAEKGRTWLPTNGWLQSQLTDNVNLNQTCNAYWGGGSVNFFKSGGGCNNTGEIAGVFLHEWGHGVDENDGGGFDNPTEAYADITALISTHVSCVGRGFYQTHNCDGYGDACLNCTGIRDQDWDQRAAHTPATPQGFATNNCPGGGGPCGREQHCEAYVSAETIYDLAVRDLTAAGMDLASAWQLTEKLWYKSRLGSGGNAYNCALPSSDGCGANSWFTKMRNIDDEDGNLNNGTPHAAAIFAAFNRHKIACGTASDSSNQSASSCPALATPTLTAIAGSNSVTLNWSAVSGASSYLVLRNDQGCASSRTIVATVPAPTTSYTDSDLPNDFPLYYSVQAQGTNAACESRVAACVSATPQPFAGSIKLGQATYACSSAILITVRDANIGAPTTIVTISSATEPTPETVVLTETSPGSARYVGTIQADSGPAAAGNNRLSIANGDPITAQYVDADDGIGGSNLLRQTTATGDCAFPIVTQVQTTGINDVHALVSWSTNEPSTSIVHYGQLKPPTSTASTVGLSSSHAVSLDGLQACTVYWLSAESTDAAGNTAIDANGGAYYHFETLGNLGSGLQSCHAGKVALAKSTVNCSDTLPITVTDLDVNLSPTAVDTIQVTVSSSTETTPETLTLIETGVNTSRFTGSISMTAGAPAPNGTLQVANGDLISVAYQDADDGAGQSAISNATAVADCLGAVGTLVQVTGITDENAQVRWITAEPTNGRVDWGTTPALGNVTNFFPNSLDHTVTLTPIQECTTIHFRITTTDAFGNQSVLDANGAPYSFTTWRIPPGVYKETFESSPAWTLEGDWQIATPQGLGTPPADPASAFEGTKVLGQDLTGLGAHPGDYEPGTIFKATSPTINASSLTGGQLRFRRKLSSFDGATATINILRNNILFNVWTSPGGSDTGWTLQTLDVSQFVDGVANVKIQFKEQAGSIGHSGWNLDRLILNSASQPAFEACGGCLKPSFTGLQSATDLQGCADTGVALSWLPAASWGTGSTGTYSVYRDTTPGFTPQASNRIALGINATTYVDATAPNGVTLYYLVRAENNETCGGGPFNGGAVDLNTSYKSAQDQTSQILPGAVAGVQVAGINDTEIRVSWPAVPNAATYHVFRAASANGPFTQIGNPSGLYFEDANQFTTGNSWYYTVKAADSCGNEGP